jgi:uncharacterized membrane protein (GlpM family)
MIFDEVEKLGKASGDTYSLMRKKPDLNSILALLRPFLVIFLQATFIFFTKLRFRRSFWSAYQVWILIGSKATT